MKITASLFFAKSLIFPKAEKKSSARKSLFGAMLCIGLSIVPLIVVVSVTNGMIEGMTERLIGLSSSHLQAYIADSIDEVSSAENLCEYAAGLKEVEGIKNVFPQVELSALAAGKNNRSGIEIRAMQKDIFKANKSFNTFFTVLEGSLDSFEKSGGKDHCAVIGQKLASDLNLHAGDTFRIISIKKINGRISPKLTSFSVSAIISSGYQELDQFWVFIPLETAYASLSLESASYGMLLETSDAFSSDLPRIQFAVREYFGRYANVYRWDEIHSAEFENFSSTKVLLIFVMLLIVLVASINISSAVIMLVMERRKEIAILKSIGASPNGIKVSFLLAALACAAGGILFGLPLGLILSVNANRIIKMLEAVTNFFIHFFSDTSIKLLDPAYYLSEIPVNLPVFQILLIVFSTLLLSVIVSYIPAKKAGREKPLDILRSL
ncbi:MAG: ABC transporter permease [Treponema sp.]|nr:ABC transporter permease [Treponema sp.]